MRPVEVLQALNSASTKADKEQVLLDAFLHGSPEFFTGLRLALDPLVRFNLTSVAEIIEADDDSGDYRFAAFLDLARRLHHQELTGETARTAIHAAANRCDVPTWNSFYRHILLKDLKVDQRMINKVFHSLLPDHPAAQQYLIPVLKCQLPQNGDASRYRARIKGRKLIDVKLTGIRALSVMEIESGCITMFSGAGRLIENVPDVRTSLQLLLPRLPGSLVLDGVLIQSAPVRYAVFDMLPLTDFRRGHCAKSQRERHRMLEVMQEAGLWTETGGLVYVVPQIEVDLDTLAGQAAFADFQRQATADACDKIMVKDPDAPYEGKRSVAWLECTSDSH